MGWSGAFHTKDRFLFSDLSEWVTVSPSSKQVSSLEPGGMKMNVPAISSLDTLRAWSKKPIKSRVLLTVTARQNMGHEGICPVVVGWIVCKRPGWGVVPLKLCLCPLQERWCWGQSTLPNRTQEWSEWPRPRRAAQRSGEGDFTLRRCLSHAVACDEVWYGWEAIEINKSRPKHPNLPAASSKQLVCKIVKIWSQPSPKKP